MYVTTVLYALFLYAGTMLAFTTAIAASTWLNNSDKEASVKTPSFIGAPKLPASEAPFVVRSRQARAG